MKISNERPNLFTRRRLIRGGAALAASLAAASIAAQDRGSADPDGSGRVTGWRDLTQDELDRAYSQGPWAPNLDAVLKRYRDNSDSARARLGAPERLRYGESDFEMLDLYRTAAQRAPLHLFIHGGAWYSEIASYYGFLAETFVRNGAHFIAIDFTNVEETEGDLRPMAEQVRHAISWTRRHAAELGGDPERLFVSGHSSGGHLAGVAVTTDWDRDFGLPPDVIKGGLCISGMYELEPVSRSARSDYVDFTDEVLEELSPHRHVDLIRAPLIIAYGTLESPEFRRQSREFAEAVRAAGKPVDLVAGPHYNHFEILETLANPYGLLGRAALVQMGLA